jgi:hypothetical protein
MAFMIENHMTLWRMVSYSVVHCWLRGDFRANGKKCFINVFS